MEHATFSTNLTNSGKAAFPPMISQIRSPLLQRQCACGGTPGPSGECEECRKKRQGALQRATANAALGNENVGNEVPPIVHTVLRSPGQPLDTQTRAFMEPRFGHDFSSVRVHTDARAAESARAVNALAYTVGRNVVFSSGQYAPHTQAGRQIMAHELTHVVQQNSWPGNVPDQLRLNPPGHVTEREASETTQSVLNGEHAPIRQSTAPLHVQRWQSPLDLVKPCPTSVRLGSSRQFNHGNISAANKEKYRTYLSNIATMNVGPGPDHRGHCMQEWLTTVSNSCPATLNAKLAHCAAHDCLPIDEKPTSFVDGHVTKSEDKSYLEGTGVNSCSVECEQRYSCDPSSLKLASGVFRIKRTYQAGTYKRKDGTTVHITTGTVDKTELASAPSQNPFPVVPPLAPPLPRTLPKGSEYA